MALNYSRGSFPRGKMGVRRGVGIIRNFSKKGVFIFFWWGSHIIKILAKKGIGAFPVKDYGLLGRLVPNPGGTGRDDRRSNGAISTRRYWGFGGLISVGTFFSLLGGQTHGGKNG